MTLLRTLLDSELVYVGFRAWLAFRASCRLLEPRYPHHIRECSGRNSGLIAWRGSARRSKRQQVTTGTTASMWIIEPGSRDWEVPSRPVLER